MSIQFSCKSCGTTLRVPDEHLGKQARCPQCQNLNVVQAEPLAADLYSNLGGDPVTPIKAANPYATGQGSIHTPGGMAGHAYPSAHRGGLILAIGIMSIVCNFMAIPGILAWVMGRSDLKQMDAGRMDPEGRGLTMAGMIMGMIMTIIGIIVIVFYFLIVAIMIAGAGVRM